MDNMEERKKLYSETRNDLLNRQLSNSENFDRAILSLSTAGLGFSLAFIKDIVPFAQVSHLKLLCLSWYMFAIAIVVTLVSFIASQLGIDKQLIFAKEYYLEGKEKSLDKPNWPAIIITYSNYVSCLVFIVAIFLTVFFVYQNILGGNKT
ncbi:hypothetical protein KJ693_02160 [bacterium]|nr:hypothetical protein [bacterium]MBU1614095.1 hypothetical protein [bacterium]